MSKQAQKSELKNQFLLVFREDHVHIKMTESPNIVMFLTAPLFIRKQKKNEMKWYEIRRNFVSQWIMVALMVQPNALKYLMTLSFYHAHDFSYKLEWINFQESLFWNSGEGRGMNLEWGVEGGCEVLRQWIKTS